MVSPRCCILYCYL